MISTWNCWLNLIAALASYKDFRVIPFYLIVLINHCFNCQKGPGGTHLEKGYGDVRPLRPPFSRSLSSSLKPPFQHVQFFKTPFSTKISNLAKFVFLEPNFKQNFRSKASNLAKIHFFKPYFFPKNQFFKPLFLVPARSLSPHFRPFGPHTYIKMKVEYPPPSAL